MTTCPKLVHLNNCAYSDNPANKEPFLNQLARVILVHNWYHSTSTCFHTCVFTWKYVFCLLTLVLKEFDMSRTGSEQVRSHWYVSSRENSWFHGKHTCQHTKFFHRIWWINVRKHVNWASWTHEFTYRTCEITDRCLLGRLYKHGNAFT